MHIIVPTSVAMTVLSGRDAKKIYNKTGTHNIIAYTQLYVHAYWLAHICARTNGTFATGPL